MKRTVKQQLEHMERLGGWLDWCLRPAAPHENKREEFASAAVVPKKEEWGFGRGATIEEANEMAIATLAQRNKRSE